MKHIITGIGALSHAEATPVVRIPLNDLALVSRARDFGAEAIIAPMIIEKIRAITGASLRSCKNWRGDSDDQSRVVLHLTIPAHDAALQPVRSQGRRHGQRRRGVDEPGAGQGGPLRARDRS